MEASKLSDNGIDGPGFGIFCFCGEPSTLRKSGTQKNPDRRFFGCAKYKTNMDCGFFYWYEPSIWLERNDLGPMRVQVNATSSRTVEHQCESSSSMNDSQELHMRTVTMQMKIEAMQKEIHELYDLKELQNRNVGKMDWKLLGFVVFFIFLYMFK